MKWKRVGFGTKVAGFDSRVARFFIAINFVSGLLDLVTDIVFLSSTTDGAVAGAVI